MLVSHKLEGTTEKNDSAHPLKFSCNNYFLIYYTRDVKCRQYSNFRNKIQSVLPSIG